jgi:transcription initiation factor TFIID subunit 12
VRGSSLLFFERHGLHTTNSERNHNIRIPGFASDMTPIALSQAGVAPAAQSAQSSKKGAQGTQNSVRAHRLAQVAQAKREAKLM